MCRLAAAVCILVALAIAGVGCSRARTDSQIANDIKARMYSDAQLKGTHLSVEVNDGWATVSGDVPSVAARYEAFTLTSQAPGVKKVIDQMSVVEPRVNRALPPGANIARVAPPPAPEAAAPAPPRTRMHRSARHAESASEQPAPPTVQAAPTGESQPSAAATPQPAPAAAPALPAPAPVQRIEIPAGTALKIRMVDSIDSETNHTGQIFHATLESPLAAGSQTIAPRGTDIYIRLVEAQSAGRLRGQSELRVELYRMELSGKSYPLVSNNYVLKGKARGKRSAVVVIGGAAIGAAIGAIAGGGKGAAIGAGVGGAGGAVYQGAKQGKQVQIPSETILNFQLAEPVEVSIHPPASQQVAPINPR